uniref:Uncharacterized protein n=1 Tax=Romanomermis culicivorax TaxID=13658 RepID=A0A915IIP7_ROMCU
MSAHPAILDELDNIVDVQQQPSNVWLEKNPLARVELDDQIHDLVSHHLGRFHVSPFTSDSIRSRAAKVFYTHFFIGLLTSVKAKNDRIHSVYQRRTQNTLELVAVYGEEDTGTLHIHKINFPGAQTEKKEPLNERRMAAIKYEIEFQMKGQQLAISEEFSIEEAEVYEYEMIEKRTNLEGDHVGLEMELTNNYVVEKEEMPTNVEALDRVTAREYEPLTKTSTPKGFWRFFEGGLVDFSDIEHEPDMVTLADIAVDTLTALDHVRINPMDKLHEIPNTLARGAGFLHASPQMLPEHALVDVDTKNINIPHGYKLIKHLKTKDHLVKIREVRYAANDKSTDHKVEEWNTHSVLQNILSDARRADGSDAQQFETNCKHYFDVTREMIADEKFGNRITSLSSMKANIFGQLKTDSNVKSLLGELKIGYLPQNVGDAYLAGALSNIDVTSFDVQQSNKVSNLAAYRMNESLLLTNIVKMEETSHQIAISIVLSEFFVYQAKYDTLNLIFKNKILDMAELLD